VEGIRGFRELKVWQKAMDAAMLVFQSSRQFPKHEQYSLTDQVCRSSRSVPSNIAEAWRKRRYPAAFVSRLNDAEGEAVETQTHVEMAFRCGYLSADHARSLDSAYEEIPAMLASMASRPDQWTLRKP
jgi:four helix bundle protein